MVGTAVVDDVGSVVDVLVGAGVVVSVGLGAVVEEDVLVGSTGAVESTEVEGSSTVVEVVGSGADETVGDGVVVVVVGVVVLEVDVVLVVVEGEVEVVLNVEAGVVLVLVLLGTVPAGSEVCVVSVTDSMLLFEPPRGVWAGASADPAAIVDGESICGVAGASHTNKTSTVRT